MYKRVYINQIITVKGYSNENFTVIENPCNKKLTIIEGKNKKCLGLFIYFKSSNDEIKRSKREFITIIN